MNVVDAIKFRASLTDGCYIAEISDIPKPRLVNDHGRHGVGFSLRVLEGDAKGRLAVIELLVNGPNRRVGRDLLVLEMWANCLGLDNASSLIELIEKLRQAAIGKRLEFALQRNEWRGVELQLTAVRLADV